MMTLMLEMLPQLPQRCSELRRVVVNDPGAREAWLLLASLARAAGPEVAARYYRRAIALDPNDPAGHLGLGALYESEQRWEEAEKEYREAISLDPKDWKPYNNLGVLLLAAGHPEEAKKEFREAISLDPKEPTAQRNLDRLG